MPSELQSAILYSQLKKINYITTKRIDIWNKYHKALEPLEKSKLIQRPIVQDYNQCNGHMYYILLKNLEIRDDFIKEMFKYNIQCTTHYIPLHLTTFGGKYYDQKNDLKNSEDIYQRIVRLPLWVGLEKYQSYIIEKVINYFN